MEKFEKKAEFEALKHTTFMALTDIAKKVNPSLVMAEYLTMLQHNFETEKNRIANRTIRGEDW
ncbi:hypothetical protein OHD16_21565 [Sphingobacterium sp. ML3W]|uniref:hypothetical protein n=1 Tax=Sphingobacterium sp. ML3W TaxID=1538644 RepID=UPI00249C63AD|nr:hypothetical protein [Sphingobacterium sp. ML3W]WFA77321.1 hypothetical protein OGI71_14705 [Sphingobacterium sp. ML3W]